MNEESLFAAAMDRSTGAERDAYLDEACANDAALRDRVGRLLAAHERTLGILDRPITPPGGSGSTRPGEGPSDDLVGLALGERYVLLEPIGEGGMGKVWLAEQTEPVRRKVAVKLVKSGMGSALVLARFEAERQALAMMDHPNIAKVLDGGESEAGRPYFVMEHVEGVPITDYCDAARLSIRERLELFVPVCKAVQHAHTKGIIHRDLKPSNVLVAVHDGEPSPKVIDFGVAKAVGTDAGERSTLTHDGQIVGTPLYMSPEQAELGGLDVDTRSDVYSLGVLLYELLTGSTPFERAGRGEAAFHEMLRVIREEEPQTPSRRLATTLELSRIAERRKIEPARLGGLLRGDLDWIVMKALEKDRDRRYETANSLATDLRRFLADEVVQARPPSTLHRVRKFVRRNKGRVAAAAALTLSLAVGLGGVLTVRSRAQAERAARSAWADASVAAAVREARGHAAGAWNLVDLPADMNRAVEAARAAIRRGDDYADGGPPAAATLADLVAARREVEDLARHSRLVVDHDDARNRFADELTGVNAHTARRGIRDRLREALARFGFDPVAGDADELGRIVVESRLRDELLAILLEWRHHAAALTENRRLQPERFVSKPSDGPDHSDRLDAVIRAARTRLGGAFARWQDLVDRSDAAGLVAFAASPEAVGFPASLASPLGRDLIRFEKYEAGRQYLRDVVDRNPQDVWLHNDLFIACVGSRPPAYVEALRHMSAAADRRPDSALFQYHLANTFAALGANDQAVAAYRKSIALGRGASIAQSGLGQALLKTKDLKGAVAALDEAVRLVPGDPNNKLALGAALGAMGRHDESRRAMLEATKLKASPVFDQGGVVPYNAACFAMNLADGKLGDVPAPAEREAYRKMAMDLLTSQWASIRERSAKEPDLIRRKAKHWVWDPDLASVREPGGLEALPPAERAAWIKFWADVRPEAK